MSQSPRTEHPFRFFDNREKYLLVVATTSEKQVIADHVGGQNRGQSALHGRPFPL